MLIDDLSDKQIIRVNCGAFHTFVVSAKGELFAFGQNKYGKLGLNIRKENTVFKSTNVQIFPFTFRTDSNSEKKEKELRREDNLFFRQAVAGYNHSMAVDENYVVYTWGYEGFGILGRKQA